MPKTVSIINRLVTPPTSPPDPKLNVSELGKLSPGQGGIVVLNINSNDEYGSSKQIPKQYKKL